MKNERKEIFPLKYSDWAYAPYPEWPATITYLRVDNCIKFLLLEGLISDLTYRKIAKKAAKKAIRKNGKGN